MYYRREEFVNALYNVYRLYKHKFTKENTKHTVNGFIDRFIPDSELVFPGIRHNRRNIDDKIVCFMNSRHGKKYDMVMTELQEVHVFIEDFKNIMDINDEFIPTTIIDKVNKDFKIDAFSLKENVNYKLKNIKIYEEVE